MLSSTRYFKNVPCPFDKNCHRPYCHFKHGELKDLANAVQATRDFVSKHSSLPGCVVRPTSTIALRNNQSQSSLQQSKLQIPNEAAPTYYPTPIGLLEDDHNIEKDKGEKNTTHTAKINATKDFRNQQPSSIKKDDSGQHQNKHTSHSLHSRSSNGSSSDEDVNSRKPAQVDTNSVNIHPETLSVTSARCHCDRHVYEEAYKMGFYCSLQTASSHFQDIMDELDDRLKNFVDASPASNAKLTKDDNTQEDSEYCDQQDLPKKSKDLQTKKQSFSAVETPSTKETYETYFTNNDCMDSLLENASNGSDNDCEDAADLEDIFETFENKGDKIETSTVQSYEKDEMEENMPKPPKRRMAHVDAVNIRQDCPVPRKKSANVKDQLMKRYHERTADAKDRKKQEVTSSERVSNNLSSSFPTKPRFEHLSSTKRVAHDPKPKEVIIVPLDTISSGIPLGTRQKYLKLVYEECTKIDPSSTEIKQRALEEEKKCLEKSHGKKALYVNSVVKCIQGLRSQVQQRTKEIAKSGISSNKNNPMFITHQQVLAGKKGTIGTWSIEKPTKIKGDISTVEEMPDHQFYQLLSRYVLTKEQLKENGYPLAVDGKMGEVTIDDPRSYFDARGINPQPKDKMRRRCDRCNKIYKVDDNGHQLMTDEYGMDVNSCVYHWGRRARTKGSGAHPGFMSYLCCQGDSMSEGCSVSKKHFTDMISAVEGGHRSGFVETMPPSNPGDNTQYPGIFALDCEMCSTTIGNELTRVTVVNLRGQSVYETMVLPPNEIIDYNTRFSGITADHLRGVTTKLRDVQAVLLSKFSSETILIGHSLESDLKALKLAHRNVVDTSVVFPHKIGPPYKIALRHLAVEYLQRIIQDSVEGHDSSEDAIAALDLMKLKVMDDYKKLLQKRT